MSTITPIAPGPSTYPSPSADETVPPSPAHADPLTELAALLVQNDHLRAEADEQARRAAREAERRAMEREVEAMHDAAEAVFVGACFQGGAALAGGGAACASAVTQVGSDAGEFEVGLEKGGQTLSSLAEPLGALLGDAPKARADARGNEARNDAERADARADEASAHRERVLRHTDSVLALVGSTLDSEHQGHFAILGNF